MSKRLNILLITSDQHRGDCYGFEGRNVKTPHLDQLARDGTRFAACIAPNLICQPTRASMLTGLLPMTHGVSDNGIDLDPRLGAQGFAAAFGAAGYATALIGKAHFATSHTFAPTGTPECRTSSADFGDDWNGPYMGFDHVELMVEGHNNWPPMKPPHGQHYERWYHMHGGGDARTALYWQRLPPDTGAIETWNSALPAAWHNSTWVGNQGIDYLRAHRDRPFCLWASFADPHHPFDAPEPWSRLHAPQDVELPFHRSLDLERRPWWHRQSLEGKPKLPEAMRRHREKLTQLPAQTDEQLRAMIANYYGMIALVDHNVGRLLIELDALDLARNTLVIFTTDHGEWLGDHGLVLKGPMAYEGLLRVGFIARGPGVPAAKVVADPISTIDVAATIADYAGVAMEDARHSRSLRPLIETDTASRDFAYSEWSLRESRFGVPLDLRTVRTRRHKLTLERHSGAGELYDLADDPHEMHNRFDDAGYANLRRELEAMIASRPRDELDVELPQVGMA
ncbi:MAG: sulfatase-like hydrolase/transferase [Betaproteobacteria bacterium]